MPANLAFICCFLTPLLGTDDCFKVYSKIIAVHVHLNEVSEGVVDVGSFRQEKATAWTHVIKEEQLLVLCKDMYTWHL